MDSSGNVYVTGAPGDNAFKIGALPSIPAIGMGGLALLAAALIGVALWWIPRRLHGTNA